MGKLEERILAKTELFLSSILEMRFGDGTGQDLQVKLASQLLTESASRLLKR